MTKLSREELTSILVNNQSLFSDFPAVENYCNAYSFNGGGVTYIKLIEELDKSNDLYKLVEKCTQHAFEMDKSTYVIFTGFDLESLIRECAIEISDGENTWISNLERVKSALDQGACCSTKNSLLHEADSCYSDLINQCDSNWIFIKNLKKFLNADTISFRLPNNTVKNV